MAKPAPGSLPDGWTVAALGDIAEIAFSGVDKKTVEGEIPVRLCNYTDVFYNRTIHRDLPFMSASATPAERDRWALKKGDVLFTKDSETPDEIGIPAHVAEDLPDVVCGYHLGRARPDPTRVTGPFLATALRTHRTRREFARIANGVTRFGLTLNATRTLPVALPPLPEQQHIAAVLGSIEQGTSSADAVTRTTIRLSDALRARLLTDGLPQSDHSYKPISPLGRVPDTWHVLPLRRVALIGAGDPAPQDPADYENGTNPFVRTADVGLVRRSGSFRGTRDRLTDDAVRRRRIRHWPAGTILVPKSGASTALNNRVRLAEPAHVSSHLATVRARNGTDEAFLYHALCHLDARTLMGNAGYPSLSLEDLGSAPIPIPTLGEQTRIARLLDSIDRTLSALGEVASASATLRNALHDDLLVRGITHTTAVGARLH